MALQLRPLSLSLEWRQLQGSASRNRAVAPGQRSNHTATVLPSGDILFLGGQPSETRLRGFVWRTRRETWEILPEIPCISSARESCVSSPTQVAAPGQQEHPVSPMTGPCGRSGHSTERVNGRLYVFGGTSSTAVLGDLWELDLQAPSWQLLHDSLSMNSTPQLSNVQLWSCESFQEGARNNSPSSSKRQPSCRQEHASGVVFVKNGQGVVSSHMVVFGGQTATGLASNRIWMYDHESLNWHTPLSSGTVPASRQGAILCESPKPDRLLLVGGASGEHIFSDAYYLTVVNQKEVHWERILCTGDTPPGLVGHAAVLAEDRQHLIVFGGSSQSSTGALSVWQLQLGAYVWRDVQCVGQPPPVLWSLTASRSPHGLLLYGGQGYDFINEDAYIGLVGHGRHRAQVDSMDADSGCMDAEGAEEVSAPAVRSVLKRPGREPLNLSSGNRGLPVLIPTGDADEFVRGLASAMRRLDLANMPTNEASKVVEALQSAHLQSIRATSDSIAYKQHLVEEGKVQPADFAKWVIETLNAVRQTAVNQLEIVHWLSKFCSSNAYSIIESNLVESNDSMSINLGVQVVESILAAIQTCQRHSALVQNTACQRLLFNLTKCLQFAESCTNSPLSTKARELLFDFVASGIISSNPRPYFIQLESPARNVFRRFVGESVLKFDSFVEKNGQFLSSGKSEMLHANDVYNCVGLSRNSSMSGGGSQRNSFGSPQGYFQRSNSGVSKSSSVTSFLATFNVEELSVEYILRLHGSLDLPRSVASGAFRAKIVTGNGPTSHSYRVFVPPEEVHSSIQETIGIVMGDILESRGAVLSSFLLFSLIAAYIHPFEDGNGRTARLLSAAFLRWHGFPVAISSRNKIVTVDQFCWAVRYAMGSGAA